MSRTWIIALGIKSNVAHTEAQELVEQCLEEYTLESQIDHITRMRYPVLNQETISFNVTMSKAKHANLSLSHINAHSVKNKIASLQHYLCHSRIDVCAITETWIKQDDPFQASDTPPQDTALYLYLDQMVNKEGGSPCTQD